MEAVDSGDPYQAYYREIERHWSWRREKLIIVSPLEFETIEAWYEGGIPLAVVIRAIDVFIEKKKRGKSQRSFLLVHVTQTVQKVWREYEALRAGADDQEGESDLFAAKLKRMAARLKKVAKSYPDMADWLTRLQDVLVSDALLGAVTFEEAGVQLETIDRELVSRFSERLSADEDADLREEIEELLGEEEDPEFFAKLYRDSVRSHFGLPALTLLG